MSVASSGKGAEDTRVKIFLLAVRRQKKIYLEMWKQIFTNTSYKAPWRCGLHNEQNYEQGVLSEWVYDIAARVLTR